jgi:hypothetical protein
MFGNPFQKRSPPHRHVEIRERGDKLEEKFYKEEEVEDGMVSQR